MKNTNMNQQQNTNERSADETYYIRGWIVTDGKCRNDSFTPLIDFTRGF